MNFIYLTFLILSINNQTNTNNINNQTNQANNTNITDPNINYCTQPITNCLSCKGNSCRLCDVFRGYYSNNDNTLCELCNNQKTNCNFSLSCGTCQICNIGYTLCSGNCRANIENCSEGDVCTNSCTKCSNGFYLNGGNCTAITTVVENCSVYSSATICSSCNSGYTLSTNNNIQICIRDSNNSNNITNTLSVDNCFSHLGNNFSCQSCITKTVNTTNYFSYNIINPYKQLENKILNDPLTTLKTTIGNLNSFNLFSSLISNNDVCISQNISNCLSVKPNSFECISCMVGYILRNGNCLRIQQNRISGCLIYIANLAVSKINGYNVVTCKTCNTNFYLLNGICLSYSSITGCINYNINYTECVACDSSKNYTLNNKICTRPTNFTETPNCNSYNSQNLCNGCNTGFALLTSNNTCGSIENCTTPLTGNPITCMTCANGHLLENNNTTCTPLASNWNCLINSPQTSTTCTRCKASYFVNNGTCTNQRNNRNYISNCEEGGSNYGCQKCLPFHIGVDKMYECVNEISNCIFYNSNGSCLLCNNGRIPNQNGTACDTNPQTTVNDCAIYNNSVCRSCNGGFYLQPTQADANVNECVNTDFSNSTTLCRLNPISGIDYNRVNSVNPDINNFNLYINNAVPTENNCTECLISTYVFNTANRTQCIPRLVANSSNPFQEGQCNSQQIRIKFYNNKTVYTCRSINDLTTQTNTRYQLDSNCYIYRNLPISSFIATNTLCAVCNYGHTIVSGSNRCTSISNCNTSTTNFGGCSTCSTGILNIQGENCLATINNCKVYSGTECIECNNFYVGTLSAATTLAANDTGLSKLLGFGSVLPIWKRDNLIKIPAYKYFFYHTTSELKYRACTQPTNLVRNAAAVTAAHATALTTNNSNNGDRSRVLAINNNETYAAYCRANNYMMYSASNGGSFHCSQITGSNSIMNIIDNNFLKQVISMQCSSGNLILSIRAVKGPFCANTGAAASLNNPIVLVFTAIGNCALTIMDWDYGTGNNPVQATVRCPFCGGNNIPDSNAQNCEAIPAAAIVNVSTCLAYDNNRNCMTCPTSMSIVNNACVNSNQLLYTGTNITQFMSNFNCSKVEWNLGLTTTGYHQSFTNIPADNSNLTATCGSCRETYIFNYSDFRCVWRNKFNFNDCLVTENEVGCVSCLNGMIQFGANIEHQLCINIPNSNEFINSAIDSNCSIYYYDPNQYYYCSECNTGFTQINGICVSNSRIPNCKNLSQNNQDVCQTCNDGYFVNNLYQCSIGNINKCIQYQGEFVCMKCESGYSLRGDNYSSSISRVSCVNTTSITNSFPNCPEVRGEEGYNRLYCVCSNNLIISNTSINFSQCLPIYIENCLTFDSSNNTQCLTCNSDRLSDQTLTNKDFILKNNVCVARTPEELIDNCLVYENNLIKCNRCAEGYYLTDTNVCKNNPTGIENCMFPIPDGSCLLCNENYYLNNNICSQVDTNNRIQNCYKYNSLQNCILCKRGYLLNQQTNNCDLLNFNNFIDDGSCVFDIIDGYPNNICNCQNSNYYFDLILKRCLTILYCLKINNNGVCEQCSNGRYFDNLSRSCINVTNSISNCNLYSSNGFCKECNINFGLNNNRCISVNSEDRVTNCQTYNTTPKCILCNPEYYLVNGTCNKLSNNNIYFSSYNNQTIGVICKSGFYMNQNRICIS